MSSSSAQKAHPLAERLVALAGERPLDGPVIEVGTGSGRNARALVEARIPNLSVPDDTPYTQLPGGRDTFGAALPALGASALIVFNNRAQRLTISWMGLAAGDFDLQGWLRLAGQGLSVGIAVSAMVVITAVVYYFGPNRKQTLRWVLPGAALATALWLLSTLAFGWYVRHITNYNVLYGSVGAGLALLVWMYVWSVIALFGCEFNAVRERRFLT